MTKKAANLEARRLFGFTAYAGKIREIYCVSFDVSGRKPNSHIATGPTWEAALQAAQEYMSERRKSEAAAAQ